VSDERPIVTEDNQDRVRQGVTGHNVRYVVIVSVALRSSSSSLSRPSPGPERPSGAKGQSARGRHYKRREGVITNVVTPEQR
jgi:hypothetical protein